MFKFPVYAGDLSLSLISRPRVESFEFEAFDCGGRDAINGHLSELFNEHSDSQTCGTFGAQPGDLSIIPILSGADLVRRILVSNRFECNGAGFSYGLRV